MSTDSNQSKECSCTAQRMHALTWIGTHATLRSQTSTSATEAACKVPELSLLLLLLLSLVSLAFVLPLF